MRDEYITLIELLEMKRKMSGSIILAPPNDGGLQS